MIAAQLRGVQSHVSPPVQITEPGGTMLTRLKKTKTGSEDTAAELPELPDLSGTDQTILRWDANDSGKEPSSKHENDLPWTPWTTPLGNWEAPVLKLLDQNQTEANFHDRVARAGPLEERRLTAVMTQLRARGEYRRLRPLPRKWRTVLNRLERKFPNFWEVVDYLRTMFTLAEYGDSIPRLDPILLTGLPGCGKTHFAECFSEQYGSGYHCVHMETAQSNSGLTGSADFWSNTKSGALFDVLTGENYANPVFHLDEIDKVSSIEYDPLGALYGLLEAGSARRFHDLSYPWITLDASAVIYICTANDSTLLPTPIRDRMREFSINLPTPDHALRLIHDIFKALKTEMPQAAHPLLLPSSSAARLVGLSPRQVKRVLREGIGRALYTGHKRLALEDLAVSEHDADEQRSIGFL
jgi:hypothetical protein